jgi:hypothetical protein
MIGKRNVLLFVGGPNAGERHDVGDGCYIEGSLFSIPLTGRSLFRCGLPIAVYRMELSVYFGKVMMFDHME